MSRNEQLFERAQRSIPAGVNSPVRAFRSVGGTHAKDNLEPLCWKCHRLLHALGRRFRK
jgi:hypothetical protein